MKNLIPFLLVIFMATAISAVIISNRTSDDMKASTANIIQGAEGNSQHIKIKAKGGFYPPLTEAKANTKTIIDVQTDNTFDCSATLVIPALKISRNLPPSGATSIEIPPQPAGSTLRAICAMNMYEFKINFKS